MRRIYLDHHSTTPLDPRVLDSMMPFLTEKFGNASSRTHSFGKEAGDGVEEARKQVAALIGAQPGEVIFTSGATESDNLAVQGIALFYRSRGDHIITTQIEHPAVLETCRHLESHGYDVTRLPVDSTGLVDPEDVRRAITPRTILISVIGASHEIGTLQAMSEIGRLARSKGVFFHCDAAQLAGKEPLDVEKMHIDLLSLSAHKIYGPKGVGALFLRRRNPRVRLQPTLFGGGQEKGHRPGTLNVPAIVGFGKACEIASREMEAERSRLRALCSQLHARLIRLGDVRLNGHPERRLAGSLNLAFGGLEASALFRALGGQIAFSSGAACSSAVPEPSYVLRALGLAPDLALGSVRLSIGRFNTADEIQLAAERFEAAVLELRPRRSRASLRG